MISSDPSVRRYYVTIPYNVAKGQRFDVIIENKTISVVRPYGVASGSKLEISAVTAGTPQYEEAVTYYRIPDYGASRVVGRIPDAGDSSRQRVRLSGLLCVWVVFDTIVFVLLMLACTLNPFATQYLSSSCNAVNPRTGELMSKAYFNLWRGYGNTPDCIDSGADFW
jgi:hypothetical protein